MCSHFEFTICKEIKNNGNRCEMYLKSHQNESLKKIKKRKKERGPIKDNAKQRQNGNEHEKKTEERKLLFCFEFECIIVRIFFESSSNYALSSAFHLKKKSPKIQNTELCLKYQKLLNF